MTLKELEKRLQALEDIEEIKQLHYKYIYALNSRNFDEIIDMFAEDMTEDGFPRGETHKGIKEITKVWRNIEEGGRGKLRHTTIVAQPVITVEGDMAKGYWLWLGRLADRRVFKSTEEADDDTIMQVLPKLGRYDMEYKKVDGKWKISYLKFTLPWPKNQYVNK